MFGELDESKNAISSAKLSFVGPEFLTWLYFFIESKGGEVILPLALGEKEKKERRVNIGIGKRISLRPLLAGDARMNITSSMLDDSGEVLQALRAGLLIDTMALEMTINERTYHFALCGADGAFSQVKIDMSFDDKAEEGFSLENIGGASGSPQDEKFSEEEQMILRISALEEIEEIVDCLFDKFLRVRIAKDYVAKELGAMRSRIVEGLASKLPKTNKEIPAELEAHVGM